MQFFTYIKSIIRSSNGILTVSDHFFYCLQVNSILPLRRPRSADRTESRNYKFLKPLLQRARDSSFVNTDTSPFSDSCSSSTISDVLSGIWFSAQTPESPASRNIKTVVLARPNSSVENLLAIKSDLEELDLSIDERIWMSIFKAKSTTDLRRHTSVLSMKKSRSLCGLSGQSSQSRSFFLLSLVFTIVRSFIVIL